MDDGDQQKLAAAVVAAAIVEDNGSFGRGGDPDLTIQVKHFLNKFFVLPPVLAKTRRMWYLMPTRWADPCLRRK